LQFKLHLFYEISFLEIKKLNIAEDQEKLPKYNLESHIKYQVTHKSCNGRIKIFGEYFAVCQHFAVCFLCSTRQTCNLCRVSFVCRVSVVSAHGKAVPNSLPCAAPSTHGKGGVCRVPDIWHTTKALAHGNQAVSRSDSCQICSQAKTEHCKLPGLLQPLTVPPQAWHTVCLDFIEGLPKSKGFDTILVVIDKFTKYGHFIPLSHPYSALSVAQLYMNNIYKLHGMPKMLVSYRDRVFTSALWQELFRLAETTLNMSSAYHPQTDGQTERLKQCLETYLRCLVQSCPSKWATWLPLAEFWYNTSFHSALGKTPFEVLYGHPPSHFGIVSTDACNVPDQQQWLTERSAMTELIQHNLQRAQQRMKHQEDKHRQEREFGVGDWVFVKL